MADAPKGWYPNPEDSLTERWWDGYRWTDATRPATPPVSPLPPPPPTPDPPTEDWSDLSMFRGGPTPPPPPDQQWIAPANLRAHRPESRLVGSILVTLFCCLPFGIAAIVNSAKVDSLWASGDYAGSMRASEQAKKWITWSIVIGLVAGVLAFMASVMSEESSSTYIGTQIGLI